MLTFLLSQICYPGPAKARTEIFANLELTQGDGVPKGVRH